MPSRFERNAEGSEDASVLERLRALARPLRNDADLDPLIERIGDARYVLLGEASHGTAEYYDFRARLSRRLIAQKGFSFVAVEGDWPDLERVNQYVKGLRSEADACAVLRTFSRWPTWMWKNLEFSQFVDWVRAHNQRLPDAERVGLHGLDVYSLWESIEAVVGYLERVDPQAASRARRAYACFAPYTGHAERYAYATSMVPTSCEDQVVKALVELRNKAQESEGQRREAYFLAEQNAIIAKNAERYYRTLVRSGRASWNLRDEHMLETLDRVTQFYGEGAKAIVWAHNTHVGDARYTDMARAGELNLGQLVREHHGAQGVVCVGFSSHSGSVIAGEEWGAPLRSMLLPQAPQGTFEDLLHRLERSAALFIFEEEPSRSPLLEPRGHRAVGVVYHPEHELSGNYVPTILPRRYDALVHIDRTTALHPLEIEPNRKAEVAETFPSGV